MKKVIFMGTPEFSTGVLKRLIEEKTVEVIAVVTQPDRAVGRKKIITPTPVKVVALEHNIPVYQPEKFSGSQELEELMQLDADLIATSSSPVIGIARCEIIAPASIFATMRIIVTPVSLSPFIIA